MTKFNNLTDTKDIFQIEHADWKRLLDFATAVYEKHQAEVSGMMTLQAIEDNRYLMASPTLLKQEVTGGSTTIEKEDLARWYVKMYQKMGDNLRFVWWHSHGNMTAFMSGIDVNTINEYAAGDWCLSLVLNTYGEYELRLNWFKPAGAYIKAHLHILNAPKPRSVSKAVSTQIERNVQVPSYANQYEKFTPKGKSQYSYNPAITQTLRLQFEGDLYMRMLTCLELLIKKYTKGDYTWGAVRVCLKDLNVYADLFDYQIIFPDKEEEWKELISDDKFNCTDLIGMLIVESCQTVP